MQKLLATTAAVALLAATPVISQDAQPLPQQDQMQAGQQQQAQSPGFLVSMEAGDILSSDLMGAAIFAFAEGAEGAGTATSWQTRTQGLEQGAASQTQQVPGAGDGQADQAQLGSEQDMQPLEGQGADAEMAEGQAAQPPAEGDQMQAESQPAMQDGQQMQAAPGGSEIAVGPIQPEQLEGLEQVGEVSEIVIGNNGEVRGIVVDVGGFFGVGARRVALDINEVSIGTNQDDPAEVYVISSADVQMLESAPEFSTDYQPFATGGMAEGGQMQQQDGADVTIVQGDEAMPQQEGVEAEMAQGDQPAQQQQQADVTVIEGDAPDGQGIGAGVAEGQQPMVQQDGADVQVVEGEQQMQQPADQQQMAGDQMDADWRGGREPFGVPQMQVEGFQQAEAAEMSVDNLLGANVYTADDDSVGDVSDVVVADNGQAQYVVLDIGGFLGIGTHTVALGFDEVTVMQSGEGVGEDLRLYVNASRDQLEAMPEYERQ